MPHVLSPARVRLAWNALLSTLWFLPSLIVFGGAALAVAMVEVSARVDAEALARWPRLFGASADSSRDMLAAIAGSLITVAGVTFSLTMVAVTQASAQFSPRILRNFMRDRASQVVLGGLAAIFTYCLVVLRTIRGGDEGTFVPSIAVLVGFFFAVLGIALLIFFIHHMASSLQASSIIARVAADTIGAVDRLFPAEVGEADAPRDPMADRARIEQEHWWPIPAPHAGYVQNVDAETLLSVACRHRTIVRMEFGVGDFVIPGLPLASIAARSGVPHPPRARTTTDASPPASQAWQQLADELTGAFDLGNYRTVEQDAGFGVRQLVDIALKALSPGINDPTTAMNAVDHLGVILARAAVRVDEPELRYEDDELRVLARGPTFESLANEGLSEIRRYAEGHVAVIARLVGVVEALAGLSLRAARRTVLARHLDLLADASERSVRAPGDRDVLDRRIASARQTLDRAPAAWPSQAGPAVRRG